MTSSPAPLPAAPPPLSLRRYRDVIITRLEQSDDALRRRVGAFLPDGQRLEGFRTVRFYGQSGDAPFPESARALAGDFTYGGFFDHQFGHFLLETLARAWWLRRCPGERILWHAWHSSLSAWQLELFELLGVSPERFVFVTEPVQVESITVAEPGFVIGSSFHPEHVAALELIPFAEPSPHRKVWLSRSALPAGKEHVDGEPEIEDELRTRGWVVVDPGTLSLEEKIALLRDAGTIAGFDGSAFHILLLARACRARIRIVVRRGALHPNFNLIARAKGLLQTHFVPSVVAMSGVDGKPARRLADIRPVLDFVDSA